MFISLWTGLAERSLVLNLTAHTEDQDLENVKHHGITFDSTVSTSSIFSTPKMTPSRNDKYGYQAQETPTSMTSGMKLQKNN